MLWTHLTVKRYSVLMNDQPKRPNWAKTQAECTFVQVFKQLCDQIERDVDHFNSLPEDDRHGRCFSCHKADWGMSMFVQMECPRLEEVVMIRDRHRSDVIEVVHNRFDHDKSTELEVTHSWNSDSLTCDLMVDGEVLTPWQVSMRVLKDAFFPGATNDNASPFEMLFRDPDEHAPL